MTRDPVYWQRLRRDKASGLAALLAIGACGVALVALIELLLPGSQASHRGNPLYWGLLLPFGWWGVELSTTRRACPGHWSPPWGSGRQLHWHVR